MNKKNKGIILKNISSIDGSVREEDVIEWFRFLRAHDLRWKPFFLFRIE